MAVMILKKLKFCSFLASCILLLSKSYGYEVRIAYSDLLPETFEVALNEFSETSTLSIKSSKRGSLPMLEEFLSDYLDLCILAMPEGVGMPIFDQSEFSKFPFGYKAVVVVANVDNPVSELSVEQLRRIFSAQEEFNIKSWRDIGLFGYSVSSIKSFSLQEENGITGDLFKYTALEGNGFRSSVKIVDMETLLSSVSSDISAIGLLPKKIDDPSIKEIYISKDEDSIGYGVSPSNIYYGDYPLSLPFYILYKERDTENLLPLLDFLMESSVATLLDEGDFYSVPKNVRENLMIDIQSLLKGDFGD